MRTIKEMCLLTGLSAKTFRYYDKIGLLRPTRIGDNGYRYYDDCSLARLQEILLYRALEFPLKDIKTILDNPSYDREAALSDQISLLEKKVSHLESVLAHARRLQKGEEAMTFKVFNQDELDNIQAEAKNRWGDSQAYQEFEQKEGMNFGQLSSEMTQLLARFGQFKDQSPEAPEVQELVKTYQDYISENFYPCTLEVLAGLGQMYLTDNRFSQTIDQAGGEGTAAFVSQAIAHYSKSQSN